MKAAYADPPYPGMARRHYADQDLCAEVNHRLLVAWLCDDFDCWTLSTSSTALQQVLALCPSDVRVGAWVKPWASWKPGINPTYAWEPVILWHGRNRGRNVATTRDWVSSSVTTNRPVRGAKPDAFCFWLFDFMGLLPDDDFTDVFPGSGVVGKCWQEWRQRIPMTFVHGVKHPKLFASQEPSA